jgi:flagellar biosynthesis/type III secretory pathway chaperone
MKTKKEQMKEWVERWKVASENLEKLQRDKLRNGNIVSELTALNSLFRETIKNRQTTTTSGLVEFQKLLRKLC